MRLPIKTQRLILNDLLMKDFPRVLEIAKHINSFAKDHEGYYPYYAFQLQEQESLDKKAFDFLKNNKASRLENPRKTYRLAIRHKGILIGSVAVDMLPSKQNGNVIYGDLGYFLDPEFGDKGYALEATKALLVHFFAQFERLDITAHPNNDYSKRLIEKIGGKTTKFLSQTEYYGEPRQAFVVSRSSFVQKLFFQQKGREHV